MIVSGEGPEKSTGIEKGAVASSDAAAPNLVVSLPACIPDRV